MKNLNHIIESLLFVAEEPLTVDRLKNILETVEPREIRSALCELAEQYEIRCGGFGLYEIAGGWQLRSRPEHKEWIKRMLQPPPQRLTRATLETLAIVAYNQPIIRSDIEHIRGVDCGGVLRQLMERRLIRVLGRKEIPGRPLIYATTKLFLELFDLKDLKDLPSPKEIEALTAAHEAINETDSEEMRPESEEMDFTLPGQSGETTPETGHPGNGFQSNRKEGLHQECSVLSPRPAPPGTMSRVPVGTRPALIADDLSKISTHPPKIPGAKARSSAPDSPSIGSVHAPLKKED